MAGTRIAVASLLVVIFQCLIVASNCENDNAGDVNFVSRHTWEAQPPTKAPSALATVPAPYAIISHTASEPCSDQVACSQRCRVIQALHMEAKAWDDIGYNFLVGGDGNVYVGRGWDVQGAHAYGYNSKSIGISFIGTFNSAAPTKQQLQAAQNLLKFGVENGKLAADFKLLGHRQVSATLSPGEVLYRIIQTWPHWTANP